MKRRAILSIGLLLMIFSGAVALETTPEGAEYRMVWILTFEGDVINSTEAIKNAVESCREANLNAIIPVVRRRGRTYYESKIEPRFNPYPEKPLLFDPLAEYIKNAHDTKGGKRRLEVHGWFIVSPIWMEEKSPPPGHILLLHPMWMSLNFNFSWQEKIPQSWLDLGVPEVEDYILRLCTELVKNYELDGLNLDYIRYREGGFGYNPIALKRFQKRYNRTDRPRPDDAQWQEWRREQVTNLVRRIYVETKKLRPQLKLSVCAITWGSPQGGFEKTSAYADVAQDWLGWAKEGIVDINLPMNYKSEEVSEQQKSYREWIKLGVDHKAEAKCVSGLGAYLNSIPATVQQIKDARKLSADGVCIFRLEVNNKENKPWQELLRALKKEVFSSPAPVAEILPFNRRNYGILCGKILLGNEPMDSFRITLSSDEGTSFTANSSGAGYYAFVKVPRGKYQLRTEFAGKPFSQSVKIGSGEITTQDIKLAK